MTLTNEFLCWRWIKFIFDVNVMVDSFLFWRLPLLSFFRKKLFSSQISIINIHLYCNFIRLFFLKHQRKLSVSCFSFLLKRLLTTHSAKSMSWNSQFYLFLKAYLKSSYFMKIQEKSYFCSANFLNVNVNFVIRIQSCGKLCLHGSSLIFVEARSYLYL